MPRRKPRNISGIKGTGAVDATGLWFLFECGRPGCPEILKVSEDESGFPDLQVGCLRCHFKNRKANILKGSQWKYCRVCEQLQPIEKFDRHKPTGRSFRSGRQLECKACKKQINAILNPKRTKDQHREAAQRRRLYTLLAGETGKIDSDKVFERFKAECFNCGKVLTRDACRLDHTLPAKYLWPLTTTTATLLCDDCNNAKHEKWPSEFYSTEQLRRLAVLTNISYEALSGTPRLNPDALKRLLGDVDDFLARWIAYPEEIKKIRRLVLELEGVDIYDLAHWVPDYLREDGPTSG